MERWTRFVLRHRVGVLGAWLAVLVAGGLAFSRLAPLLSNEFNVPGTDSERARTILQDRFGQRPDGNFLVLFEVKDAGDPALRARLATTLGRAARVVPTSSVEPLVAAGPRLLVGTIDTRLELSTAKNYTNDLRKAIGGPAGTTTYVTGLAATQADLDPVFAHDLAKGESIALPIALLVLLAVFGISVAVTIPFIFAACTVMGTLGVVFVVAHYMQMATYVTNLVQLIGLGIAIDYSLLIVYRFREELQRGGSVEDAIVTTMTTAGRAVVFSGATVAIGLALLLFLPLPFMRSMGLGGFLIPLVSIAAALTLQPALLSLYGRRGTRSVLFGGVPAGDRGFWHRLAGSIMQRPLAFLAAGGALLVALAIPVFALHLTPGENAGTPQRLESVEGFAVLRDAIGPGALSPALVVVDGGAPGRVNDPATRAAIGRLLEEVRADPEVVAAAPGRPAADPSGRYAQLSITGRHDYGEPGAQAFARRLRDDLIPGARFPAGVQVLAGGGGPFGIDFLDTAYRYFPWLVVGVLLLTYLVLMRAFRSLLLPLKAVVLNLLSVGASYGMLVIVFKWGVGRHLLGLYQYPQIEGWIPIFLFAMLFGLSMDYEVFIVSRMREAWDSGDDNAAAVAHGLERTGRIVTAAAIVMCAAFAGFVAGSILGLQEFGLGLAVAIFIDATVVRALLVPSLMALFGRWNWWLPAGVARVLRVPPSPLAERAGKPALRPAGR